MCPAREPWSLSSASKQEAATRDGMGPRLAPAGPHCFQLRVRRRNAKGTPGDTFQKRPQNLLAAISSCTSELDGEATAYEAFELLGTPGPLRTNHFDSRTEAESCVARLDSFRRLR